MDVRPDARDLRGTLAVPSAVDSQNTCFPVSTEAWTRPSQPSSHSPNSTKQHAARPVTSYWDPKEPHRRPSPPPRVAAGGEGQADEGPCKPGRVGPGTYRQVQPVQTGGLPVQLVQVQAGPLAKEPIGATLSSIG